METLLAGTVSVNLKVSVSVRVAAPVGGDVTGVPWLCPACPVQPGTDEPSEFFCQLLTCIDHTLSAVART